MKTFTQQSKEKMRTAALRRERRRKRAADRLALYEAKFGKLSLAELRKP